MYGSKPQPPPEIVAFYERGLEERRLTEGDGLLEFARTQAILRRVLPPPSARILDVGGGPGTYAAWLALAGYDATLIDPVPLHLEQARTRSAAQPEHPFVVQAGDARSLDHDDESVDAVLLLGPLYHLTERRDRLCAWQEARRVVQPGGVVVAASITRFAALLDGGRRGWLATRPAFAAAAISDARHGQHRAVDQESFTWAYFHHPDELRAEACEAGLESVELVGVEGPWWLLGDLPARHDDPAQWQSLLDAAELMESEPSLLGVSPHVLAIGRRAAL